MAGKFIFGIFVLLKMPFRQALPTLYVIAEHNNVLDGTGVVASLPSLTNLLFICKSKKNKLRKK